MMSFIGDDDTHTHVLMLFVRSFPLLLNSPSARVVVASESFFVIC